MVRHRADNMAEFNNFSKNANACEQLNLFATQNVGSETGNIDKVVPDLTESFEAKHMDRAWTVCYGTTLIILLFLLFLWFYFERLD